MPRMVTLVAWISAPKWLSLDEASFLSGHSPDMLRGMAERGEAEARRVGAGWLIEKTDLRDYQETLLEVLLGCWD